MVELLKVTVGEDVHVLPTPSEYSNIPQELVKSGRSANGKLYKKRIAIKQSITVAWNAISRAQLQELDSLTGTNSFKLTYFDQLSGEMKSGTFYRGSDYQITGLGAFLKDPNTAAPLGHVGYKVQMSFVEF